VITYYPCVETATSRRPSAERRPEIARAALRIIGERGRRALTTANLAAELGLSSGALFRHFASLEDVLREAVRVALLEVAATFPDRSLAPLERLLALAGNRMRLIAADRGIGWLLRSDQAQLTLPDDASALLRSLAKSSQRFLLTALREGADDGSIRGDVDPEILLLTVTGTVHAWVGMPGIHQKTKGARERDATAVLSALALLLAPGDKRR